MTSGPPTEYEKLSPDEAARVDAACDAFEQAWKAGRTAEENSRDKGPRIATFLDGWGEPQRTILARELIALDRACRQRYGVEVRLEDYEGLGAADETPAPSGPEVAKAVRFQVGDWPRLPGFELLQVLGSGGMGVVFKARQAALDREVAVKLLRDAHLADAAQRERFIQEARAVARLQHPHLVQVHEFGELPSVGGTTSQPYLVLEYVTGGSLADILRGSPRPPREAARLVETLADAIHYAHQQGVIHRDLKPANVLLSYPLSVASCQNDETKAKRADNWQPTTDNFVAKITDFGLAKFQAGSDLTRTGDVLGTPSYMAPEQTVGKPGIITAAVDVYGLGAILYEALTGRPPFRAETAVATVLQVQHEDPIPPRRLQPTVPRDLETICLKCLRKEPGRRYATAQAMAEDLRRFLAGEPIRARRIGALERVAKWTRRRPATAALMAVTGLAAALLLAVLVAGDVHIRQKNQAIETALHGEIEARNTLSETLDRERRTLYFHRIRLAQAALGGNNARQAEVYLDKCLPEPTRSDLRDWEWHYLKRICHAELLTFAAHTDRLRDVAFSPDGKRVASLSMDGALKVWDALTGRVHFEFSALPSKTWQRRLAYSPDGKYLAVADPADHTFKVLAADDGRLRHTLRGTDVAFSADGKRVAAVDLSVGQARIYDPDTGAELSAYSVPTGSNRTLGFRADALWMAVVQGDQSITILNVAEAEGRLTLRGVALPVHDLVFSPDRQFLAVACQDGSLKLWNVVRGQEIFDIAAHTGDTHCVNFSPDGQRIASADTLGSIKIWDLKGRTMETLPGHAIATSQLAFSPDGRRIASCSQDQKVKIWDTSRDPKAIVLRGHATFVAGIRFSPDGQRIASVGLDGSVKVWDPATGGTLLNWSAGVTRGLSHVTFSPDGGRLLTANHATVKTWDAATGQPLDVQAAGEADASALAVSPCGTYLTWAERRGHQIMLHNLKTGQAMLPLRGHTDEINGLAFTSNGQRLVSGGSDQTTRIWETATGREIFTLEGHTGRVNCVAVSADGTMIATGGYDSMIRLWDAQTGRQIREFKNPYGRSAVWALCFSPNGRRLASGNFDAAVTLWDTESGEEVLSLPTHRMIVTAIDFSPDGRRLAGVVNDGTIMIWDGTPLPE